MYAMKVMTRPVVTVPADATVWAAADILLGARVSAAPVVDADGRMCFISRPSESWPTTPAHVVSTSSPRSMDRPTDEALLAVPGGQPLGAVWTRRSL